MLRTSKKNLKERLLRAVASRLSEHGFEERIRGQSVWKWIEEGRTSFHLSFIDHAEGFDVTADVAIRFDSLEDLVNSDKEYLSKSEKADTYTIGAELGNMSKGSQIRWSVVGAGDVERVADDILKRYLQVAKPFFEKYSQMHVALEILSGDDKEAWTYCTFHDARAQRAVGLARLLGVGERELKALIMKKDEYLTERDDFGLDEFRRFAKRVA